MSNILEQPVDLIMGVGPKTLENLHSLSIFKIRDLLYNIPSRLESNIVLNKPLGENTKIITKGIIESQVVTNFYGQKLNKSQFLLQTNIGTVKVIFFNQLYLKKILIEGTEILLKGTYSSAKNTITATKISTNKDDFINFQEDSIEMYYSLKKGITQKKYRQLIINALDIVNKSSDFLDLVPKNFKGIWNFKKILNSIHNPESIEIYEKAKKMFAFHELLDYQLKLQLHNIDNKISNTQYQIPIKNENIIFFQNTLDFNLTNSQKNVIEEIVGDLKKPYKMDRLLQGDVGCGKTVVAGNIVYCVVKEGGQCAIMSPTEILSIQHFETFYDLFKELEVSVALLTSSTPKKEKNKILRLLAEGKIDLIIGTHALIQEDVVFKNLKLAITDEQHRFGVNQRKTLGNKGDYVHTLMMTATPIPRSLAITLITDIKVSTISELPKGRKKVITMKASNKQFKNVINKIITELKKGHQAYVVCPLIEESEKMDLQNIDDVYKKIKENLPGEYKVAHLHGKMNAQEKENIIDEYVKNQVQILISTTVIEVGVNVPNATLMIVVDAHRFGLSTLHQLRGRVGRSAFESFCILVTDKKSERIDIMCIENDGFKISEFDLKNRGPGDFFGTKQSGLPSFKVADILYDTELMYLAKKLATRLIEVTDDRVKLQNYLGISDIVY